MKKLRHDLPRADAKGKNKICFIMPIYQPHFEWANAFIRSFFKFDFEKQADLIFIFTDKKRAKSL